MNVSQFRRHATNSKTSRAKKHLREMIDRRKHRISTARMEMVDSQLVFSIIEPNCSLPYSTVPELGLRDARPAGWVTYCSICASTMPRAQNRAAKGSIIL